MEVIMHKALVAYFSATGNTKQVASKLSKVISGNLHEIVPKDAYTSNDLNWKDKQSRTTKEMNDKSYRPEISDQVDNMDSYLSRIPNLVGCSSNNCKYILGKI